MKHIINTHQDRGQRQRQRGTEGEKGGHGETERETEGDRGRQRGTEGDIGRQSDRGGQRETERQSRAEGDSGGQRETQGDRATEGDRYAQQKVSAPVMRCAGDSVLPASVLVLVNMMLVHLTEHTGMDGQADGRRQRRVRTLPSKTTQTDRRHVAQQEESICSRLIGLFVSTS